MSNKEAWVVARQRNESMSEEEKARTALKMKELGIDINIIAAATGKSVEWVKGLY